MWKSAIELIPCENERNLIILDTDGIGNDCKDNGEGNATEITMLMVTSMKTKYPFFM